MNGILRRKIDDYLSAWKNNPERKPLIVKGARQIGKTRSVEWFASRNYTSVVQINFVEQKKYRSVFDDGFEVDAIIRNKNFSGISGLQQQLLRDYAEDITKYVEGLDKAKVKAVYNHISTFWRKKTSGSK